MNPNRVAEIFKQIEGYRIDLPRDAAHLGPSFLMDLTGTCRNYTNAVTQLLNEIQAERTSVQRALSAANTDFEIRQDELLAADEAVKRLPNIADRQATVRVALREQRNRVTALEAALQDLVNIEKAVRLVYNELKATAGEIRQQRQLLHDDLSLQGYKGSEGGTPARPLPSVRNGPWPAQAFQETAVSESETLASIDKLLAEGTEEGTEEGDDAPSTLENPSDKKTS